MNKLEQPDRQAADSDSPPAGKTPSKSCTPDLEASFNMLLAGSSDPVALKDRNGYHLLANQAYCRLLGKSDEEIVGKTDFDLFPDNEAERFCRDDQEVFATAGAQRIEDEITVAGGRCWLRISRTPVNDENGGVSGVLLSIRDISDHRQTITALRASERRLQKITDALPALVSYVDAGERYRFNNRAYRSWFGCDVVGLSVQEVLGIEAYRIAQPNIRVALTGKEVQYEAWIPYKDGVRRYVRVEYIPDTDADGRTRGFYVLVNDLSEREQTRQAGEQKDLLLRQLFDHSPIGLALLPLSDPTGQPTEPLVNPAMLEFFGYEGADPSGLPLDELFHPEDQQPEGVLIRKLLAGDLLNYKLERRFIRKDGSESWGNMSISLLRDTEDRPVRVLSALEDINSRKVVEEQLRKAHEELESRVRIRTLDLQARKDELEEVNTALRVVLRQREEDRDRIENQLLANVQQLVGPSLERLRKSGLSASQLDRLDILAANLRQITSACVNNSGALNLQLTPTELQIADLVKQGYASKKIAELLHLSPETIGVHRKNIRKKLDITDKKINLRTYLSSLDQP